MSNKKKVEAVLFSLGKEVTTEKLSELCGLGVEEVKKVMGELKEEYNSRDHSLSIINRGDNWKLTVKDEFLPIVSKLVEGTDLDKALMETLAVIAWKYPVTQSEVVKLRHNKAYEHIKRLMELDFVEKERTGRTYKLKLTKKFFEYFDLPSEEAKKAFLKNIPEGVLRKAEEVDREADEVGRLVVAEKKEKAAKEEIREATGKIKEQGRKEKAAKAAEMKELIVKGEAWADELNKEMEEKPEEEDDDEDEMEEEAMQELVEEATGEGEEGDEDETGEEVEEPKKEQISRVFQ